MKHRCRTVEKVYSREGRVHRSRGVTVDGREVMVGRPARSPVVVGVVGCWTW